MLEFPIQLQPSSERAGERIWMAGFNDLTTEILAEMKFSVCPRFECHKV